MSSSPNRQTSPREERELSPQGQAAGSPRGRSPSPTRSPRRSSPSPTRSPRRSPARSPRRDDAGSSSTDQIDTIHVNNLSLRTTEDTLKEIFGKYGQIESCKILVDPHTRESRGFAFIRYSTSADASEALTQMNRQPIDGRDVIIQKARRARERSPTPGQYMGRSKDRGYGRHRSPPRHRSSPYDRDRSYRDDRRDDRRDDYRRDDRRDDRGSRYRRSRSPDRRRDDYRRDDRERSDRAY